MKPHCENCCSERIVVTINWSKTVTKHYCSLCHPKLIEGNGFYLR